MEPASDSLKFWHECIACGDKFSPDKFYYTCPACGGLLLVERDEQAIKVTLGTGDRLKLYFDTLRYGTARREYPNNSGVWLWRDFILPGFPSDSIISLKEGQTDLFEVPSWLGSEFEIDNLYIKMEGQSPSESFKDRGMPVAVSDALRLQTEHPEQGITGVCCASTGDTSAAAAVYSAYVRDKLDCLVLVPNDKIADAQLFQAVAHGAKVRAIDHPDGFDGCMKLVAQFTTNHPEYALVNSKNDMRIVGQETIGLEILQDLHWNVPDWIAIPVGNGGNLTALLNTLRRALDFELIDRLPGVIVGQTAAADTLVRWQESGYTSYEPHEFKDTVASAMNINDPVSFPRIKKLYEQFDIHFVRDDEQTIKDRWAQTLRAGAAICPQGAVALNGVIEAKRNGTIKQSDTVVVISTASALKFTDAGIRYHKDLNQFSNPYIVVNESLGELERSL